MRRTTAFLLLITLSTTPSYAAEPAPSAPGAQAEATGASWIAPFFARAVRDWVIGKVLDYGYDRARLAILGEDAARHCSDIRGMVSLSPQDRQTLTDAESTYRMLAATLARREFSDEEARRRVAALERHMDQRLEQITRRLQELERRLHALEREQQRQYRILVDLQGRIVRLEHGLYDLDGRLVQQGQRIDALYDGLHSATTSIETLQGQLAQTNEKVEAISTVVWADPHRYLRHGTYFSLFGMYADATAMAGDASFGLGASVQANLSKRIGIYGEAVIIPIKATDGVAPDGSPLEWLTFPVMVGIAFDLLPPQSPVSIQFSGGGGISYSSLRYYPDDYDPELGNWTGVKDVLSLVGTGKIEIGAAPVLSDFVPVLTIGYLGLQNPMNYSGGTMSSNAGRELLYLSLGGRLRTNLPGDRARNHR